MTLVLSGGLRGVFIYVPIWGGGEWRAFLSQFVFLSLMVIPKVLSEG